MRIYIKAHRNKMYDCYRKIIHSIKVEFVDRYHGNFDDLNKTHTLISVLEYHIKARSNDGVRLKEHEVKEASSKKGFLKVVKDRYYVFAVRNGFVYLLSEPLPHGEGTAISDRHLLAQRQWLAVNIIDRHHEQYYGLLFEMEE